MVLGDLNLEGFLFVLRIRSEFGFKTCETFSAVLDPSAFEQLNVIAASQRHGFGINRFEVGNALPFERLSDLGKSVQQIDVGKV